MDKDIPERGECSDEMCAPMGAYRETCPLTCKLCAPPPDTGGGANANGGGDDVLGGIGGNSNGGGGGGGGGGGSDDDDDNGTSGSDDDGVSADMMIPAGVFLGTAAAVQYVPFPARGCY